MLPPHKVLHWFLLSQRSYLTISFRTSFVCVYFYNTGICGLNMDIISRTITFVGSWLINLCPRDKREVTNVLRNKYTYKRQNCYGQHPQLITNIRIILVWTHLADKLATKKALKQADACKETGFFLRKRIEKRVKRFPHTF